METLRVSAQSIPKSVAGAIAAVIRSNKSCEVVSIGASAINQAVKSIATARGYLAPEGLDIIATPAFSHIELEAGTRTSIKFLVERRPSST